MKSKIVRAFALPALVGLLVGLLGFLAVMAYSQSQPSLYTARVTTYVAPTLEKGKGVDAAYPTISTANLAASVEYAHSPEVLQAVHDAVPGAPAPDALSGAITADPIPASTVIRFNVSNAEQQMAVKLSTALARQMEKADIFGGVGHFKAVNADKPVVEQVSPDKKLGKGLALLFGVILGVAAAGIWLMLLPKILFRMQVRRLVDDPTVAVLDATTPTKADRSLALLDSVGGARVMALGPDAAARAHAFAANMPEGRVSSDPNAHVLLLAPRGQITPAELDAGIGLIERSGRKLLAVALV